MFTVEFYETENGYSELWDFLENLRIKSARSKDARIQFNQISLYIELLQQKGTNLPDKITKHIEDNLWEFFISITKKISLFSYTISGKKHRKHQKEKSIKPKPK